MYFFRYISLFVLFCVLDVGVSYAGFVASINTKIDQAQTDFCTQRFDENIKYNIFDDNSCQKIVNRQVWFQNPDYVPDDLVIIKWTWLINLNNYKVRQIAQYNLEKMSDAFFEKFSTKIVINSAYRDPHSQQFLIMNWLGEKYTADIWHSEHQAGLAIDIWYNNKKRLSDYTSRLASNGHLYGFHNTYQKWLKIDGYNVEPWHRRFVGQEMATELYDRHITLNEYYSQQIKYLELLWYKTINGSLINFYAMCM